MVLSAELLQWMTSTIESAPRPRVDLRRADRVALRGSIELFLLHGDARGGAVSNDIEGPITAGVRNASAAGMRLEIPQHVHDGQQILIRLPRMDNQPLMLLSEVVHARWDETFSNTGIRFLHTLSQDEQSPAPPGQIRAPSAC